MKGLEKMTALILEEANAAANALIAEAQTEAENVLADYRQRADAERKEDAEKAQNEATALLQRAEASGRQIRRNKLLEAKSALLDAAFDRALQDLIALPDKERLEIYTAMLNRATKEQLAAEKAALENDRYGEYTAPSAYGLLLSEKDLSTIGSQLVEAAAKLLEPVGKTVTLSSKAAEITGGFVVVCGDIELSCTLAGYMDQIRSRIEGDVCQILFA